MIAKRIRAATELAADDLGQHREPADAIRTRLEKGGYTEAEVLGDWFPDDPG